MSNHAVASGIAIPSLNEHGQAHAQLPGRLETYSRIRDVYALHFGRPRQSVLVLPGNGVDLPRGTPQMPPYVLTHRKTAASVQAVVTAKAAILRTIAPNLSL